MRLLIVCGAGLALAGCDMGSQSVNLEGCALDSPGGALERVATSDLRLEDGAITAVDDEGRETRHISYGAGVLVCVKTPED